MFCLHSSMLAACLVTSQDRVVLFCFGWINCYLWRVHRWQMSTSDFFFFFLQWGTSDFLYSLCRKARTPFGQNLISLFKLKKSFLKLIRDIVFKQGSSLFNVPVWPQIKMHYNIKLNDFYQCFWLNYFISSLTFFPHNLICSSSISWYVPNSKTLTAGGSHSPLTEVPIFELENVEKVINLLSFVGCYINHLNLLH